MKIEQISATTYTIRDFIQTPKGLKESCQKLAEIGFQAVELASLPTDSITAEETVQICTDFGLRITSCHEDLATILDNPETLIERAHTLGTQYLVYAWPHDTEFDNPDSIKHLIDRLNSAGSIMQAANINLLYHNHALELKKVDDRTVLDTIFESINPNHLKAELDTYWIQRGGGDPIAWCRKMHGRLPLLHLKDVTVYSGNDSTMGEIGSGNLDFKGIVKAAESSGCKTFVIEQDVCPGNPFSSLEKSFRYIKSNLLS